MRISDWSSDVCSSDLLDLLTLDSEGVVFAGGLDRHPIHQLQHVGILPAALLQAGDGQTAVQQPARHAKRQAVIGSLPAGRTELAGIGSAPDRLLRRADDDPGDPGDTTGLLKAKGSAGRAQRLKRALRSEERREGKESVRTVRT